MSTFRFIEDPAKRQIRCDIHRAPTGDLNAFRLRQAWESSGFEACHLFPDRLEPGLVQALNALAASPNNGAETDDDPDSEPPIASFVIAERRDASVSVSVSDDGMHADAAVVTAAGGNPLTDEALREALDQAGIRYGIDDNAVSALVADCATQPPGSNLRRSVASGKPAARGVPSRFENLVVPIQDRVLQPQERDDGSVDFLDLGEIETVAAGEPLVRRHPAHAGESGWTVNGTEILSEVPSETPFAVGEGTAIDESDPNLLLATRTGVPHRVPSGMSVNDVLELAEVDLHTGHVEFEGSLVVKGDIRPDMKVRVTKDLMVGGFIESAYIEAGGDVSAKKGIIGPPARGATHSCTVKARNIVTHYAQNAHLEAAEDITLSTNLVNSVVIGCRSVRAGGDRPRNSHVVGGDIHVRESLSAAILGSETASATRLIFDDAILALRADIEGRHTQKNYLLETGQALEKSMREIAQRPRTDAVNAMLEKVANTINAYRAEREQLDEADAADRARIAELIAGCRVTAAVRIHAGVELVCLDARYRFGADRGPGTLTIKDGNWSEQSDKPA